MPYKPGKFFCDTDFGVYAPHSKFTVASNFFLQVTLPRVLRSSRPAALNVILVTPREVMVSALISTDFSVVRCLFLVCTGFVTCAIYHPG